MDTLRLLVVEESLNLAEELATAIRNSGCAVRMSRIDDNEGFVQQITASEWDMVLAPIALKDFTTMKALDAIHDANKDIPLILLVKAEDKDEKIEEILDKGARDAVRYTSLNRLQICVSREFKSLSQRRTLKRAMKALTDAEKRCRILIDSSRDAITYIHDGMHVYANSTYLEQFGYNAMDEIEGMPMMDMIGSDDHQKFKNFLKNYKNNKSGEQKLQIRGKRLDESQFDAIMEFAPATIDMEPCTQIIIRNQGNSKELESKLKYLSNQDLLTGLYNRQYLTEEIDLAIGRAKSEGQEAYLVYAEVDHFGKLKESIGIAGNDVVLNDFANILKVTTQKLADIVLARFSDSSFAVLLTKGSIDLAQRLAEAMRKTMEDFIFDIEGQSLTTTCSIGISTINDICENAQDVIANVDVAYNIAKNRGGNTIHTFDPIRDAKAGQERDQHWVSLIRIALEKNQFHLLFQPIVSLHGENTEIYEVLLRMRDAQGAVIMPNLFFPPAEVAGLTPHIDKWVVDKAVGILHEQRQAGSLTRFFIKLSSSTLRDESFLPWVARRLSQARMKGDCITFEISEKDAVGYLKHAKYFCKNAHELHCKVTIDHFGTGKESFNCLKHLDVDYLKIDGSFVHNLANDKKNQAMVKSINEMAHGMGKLTIAEFVQDATSLAMLWQYGVNFIQGNYLQKPYENLSYDFTSESEIV